MINSIIKAVETSVKYAWGLLVVCLFVLFCPDDWSSQIGILEIRSKYLGYIWILLVFSSAICLGLVVTKVLSWMSSNRKKSKRLIQIEAQKIEVIKRLSSLNNEEYTWIACCLNKGVQTLHATQVNPTANALLSKGIVTCGGGSITALPFTIRDFIWEHLLDSKDYFLSPDIQNNSNVLHNLENFERNLQKVV